MKHQATLFTTPVLRPAMRWLSRGYLRLCGWKLEGSLPPEAQRCVMIAAPHTSNWDMPYMLMAGFAFKLQVRWMGKASIFRWPWGPLMRWLGGIAVHRDARSNLVASSVEALKNAPGPLQLLIAPEGTRGLVREWKTGFYRIAQGAGLPIVPTYLDFGGKRIGLGPVFWPSGDLEADIAQLRAFYAPYKGLREALFHQDGA
ncbi:lysophospholipid acyltransferase family protein [Inhella gelatinilytica]|uniref:Lysophospholipid acyltransferase family protein n=1 Tax=Inhella gelatinilytica TaxID=2795030 RepID=A0A931IXQ9_9BURK|nr:lysophospholipid acyltransferase family protein [Inhella gelatinilytica]MBH9551948.1 lysophospholipid acyltransferase family protein [Inhella gelatinilytica]